MNAAAVIPHADELLTAREVALLLNITPRAVRLRMDGIAPVMRDGFQAWAFGAFPVDYQEELLFARKQTGAWTVAEAAKFVGPRWEPKKPFASLPALTQEKAFKVKAVMVVYYAALDAALDKGRDEDAARHEAKCAARSQWLAEFAESVSERTIERRVAKIELRAGVGGIERLRIEAFADEKSCEHTNQRKENRAKNRVPAELIELFKLRCVQPGANMASAHRSIEKDWQVGREVAGLEPRTQKNQPFPFKLTQLKKFAPSDAARVLGNLGKAAAQRDALNHITRTYADLRPCEMYVMDDTRINVVVLSDATGKPIVVQCYVALELSSRKVVGYVIREGNMRATDVDALMARVFRTSGIARLGAGYRTVFLLERGTVACSPQRRQFIEAAYPEQLEIKVTSMNGGRNVPGDYVQKASGHWMGKGAIESFMRTLGYILRDLPGQRGSVYQEAPAVVGDPAKPHAGGMVDEAVRTVQAARAATFARSMAREIAPHALQSVQALGVKTDLLFASQFRQRFAQAIEHYNETRGHRREGFDQVEVPNALGGISHQAESSNDRWYRLLAREEKNGTAPEQITAADTAMLLAHKARPVTITQQGAEITVDGKLIRYAKPGSQACVEAGRVTGSKTKFTALVDEDNLDEIFILRSGDGIFIEALPRYVKAGANDRPALKKAYDDSRLSHNRARHELEQITQGQMQDRAADADENASKFHGVVATTVGCRESGSVTGLLKAMKRERRQLAENPPAGSPSRHQPEADDVAALRASLKGSS